MKRYRCISVTARGLFCLLLTFLLIKTADVPIQTAAQGRPLPILMYHGILKDPARGGDYVISPQLLESDLAFLKSRGYTSLLPSELYEAVTKGEDLPPKPVMITFDDGYLNNYTYAFPIIKKYNVKTVISPIAYWSDFNTENPDPNPSYANMTWEQVKEMSQSGLVEFQNHSYNMHSTDKGRKGSAKASGETSDEYRRIFFNDFMKAHRAIYNATGTHPVAYAYPFGSISDESKTILKCMDYKISFSCNSGFNYLTGKEDELFGLKRFNRTPEAPVSKLLADY